MDSVAGKALGAVLGKIDEIRQEYGLLSSTEAMDKAIAEARKAEADEIYVGWQRWVQKWGGKAPGPIEMMAILNAVLDAQKRSMTEEKRIMLRNAAINALDPDLYEQGMTARILEIMDQLNAPEMRALAVWVAVPQGTWADVEIDSVEATYIPRFVSLGLLVETRNRDQVRLLETIQPGDCRPGESLPSKTKFTHWRERYRTTELAKRVVRYASEPPPVEP